MPVTAAWTGMLANMLELPHTANDNSIAEPGSIDSHVEPAGEQAFFDDIDDVTNYLNNLFINYVDKDDIHDPILEDDWRRRNFASCR